MIIGGRRFKILNLCSTHNNSLEWDFTMVDKSYPHFSDPKRNKRMHPLENLIRT